MPRWRPSAGERSTACCGPAASRASVVGRAYDEPMSQVPDSAISPTPHFYMIRGRAAEIARSFGSPVGGPEHMFLAMLHDGGWPVSVISPRADLAQVEEAVLSILGSPGYSPPPRPRL